MITCIVLIAFLLLLTDMLSHLYHHPKLIHGYGLIAKLTTVRVIRIRATQFV